MAIVKSIPSNFGIPATYHNIGVLRWVKETQSAVLEINSFSDKSSRDKGMRPLQVETETITGQKDAPSLVQAYALLKALPDWTDAVDA
jgi:hypothetical protein